MDGKVCCVSETDSAIYIIRIRLELRKCKILVLLFYGPLWMDNFEVIGIWIGSCVELGNCNGTSQWIRQVSLV